MEKGLRDKISHLANNAIANHVFPGCAIGIVTKNGKIVILPFGRFTYDASSKNVDETAIYDVASVTKVIPTSMLAWMLLEERLLSLSTPLIHFLPEYQGMYREKITLFHLLTQSLAFPFSLSSLAKKTPQEIMSKIINAKLSSPPGHSYQYTNTTSILLGMLLERVAGKKIDQLAEEYLFGPLGMMETAFHPDKFAVERIVPTEAIHGEIIQGKVHDESARQLSSVRSVGSAGLFSTAGDLLKVLRMLLLRGTMNHHQFFRPSTVGKMFQSVTLGNGEVVGAGFEMNRLWMGKTHSQKAIGKTGFTGCFIFCDLKKGLGVVQLANRTYPHRPKTNLEINSFRSNIIDLILSSNAS